MIKLGDQEFVTSSYTNATGACVEVGSDSPAAVQMSDSKFNHSEEALAAKPVMTLSPAAFASMVAFARTASV